jgi:hypothetical protein
MCHPEKTLAAELLPRVGSDYGLYRLKRVWVIHWQRLLLGNVLIVYTVKRGQTKRNFTLRRELKPYGVYYRASNTKDFTLRCMRTGSEDTSRNYFIM